MPTSHYKKIPAVLGVVSYFPDESINSVLDVGVGFGKYGMLFREHLDIRKGRYKKADWRVRIDGVEAFSPYLTRLHTYIYNGVLVGNISSIWETLPRYDIVILSDIVEHMPVNEGTRIMINLLNEKCTKAMVVSFPPVFGENSNKGYEYNPFEKHRCQWKLEDFKALFGDSIIAPTPTVIYVLRT